MIDSRADLIEDAYPFEDRHDAQRRAWGEPEIERDLTEHAPANTLWFGQPGARELRQMRADHQLQNSPAARRQAAGDKSRRATSPHDDVPPNRLSPSAAVQGHESQAGDGEPKDEAA